ncbi:chromosome partitioning protein [Thermosulfidibacter takaii ABI70S6]|uniref:Chromosome partitioning protein n=1 Tax=Thermosulfidibacter takaii (strain DSM 17441 / JCM 13301 / NBRC 103674 / ABI70S6) TaxID=1298851 RepID=A0A0S3QTF7_THET7|nr:ParA family protein [Thermosulfidibacter takaii]BAT71604.1 chromosome partitioning protein [Thermosulfidibacter takaii ABI70S6]
MLKICFISMKGGTGKTTLSLLFTYFMADRGKNVLLMDMDPQGNTTIACAEGLVFDEKGFLKLGMPYIIQDFLTPQVTDEKLKETVKHNSIFLEPIKGKGFHLIPNFLEAHKYDLHLTANHVVPVFVNEITNLLPAEVDVIVMDCPPYLSSLSYAALFGADVIVIPAEASKFGLVGVELLLTVVEDVIRKRGRPYNNIVIQPNRIRPTKAASFYLDAMRERYGEFLADEYFKETVEVQRMIREGIKAFSVGANEARSSILRAIESLGSRVMVY